MSRSGKGYEIGRGRPPKATQWKKEKAPIRAADHLPGRPASSR
jgi:hypothetical protein